MRKELFLDNVLKTALILVVLVVTMMFTTNCASGGQPLPATHVVTTGPQPRTDVEMIPWPQEYIVGESVVIGVFRISQATIQAIRFEILPVELTVPFTDISVTNQNGETLNGVVVQPNAHTVQINLNYTPEATMDYLYIKAKIPKGVQNGTYAIDVNIVGTAGDTPFDAAFFGGEFTLDE